MKPIKLFFSILVLLIFIVTPQVKAQKRYPFGERVTSALTSATTISVTPNATLELYTLAADTNVTFNALTTYSVMADQVVFRIKGNTRQRIIIWGTNIDGLNDTIATGKTWTYSFMWDGTAYKKLCRSITD
jgi:hypothetical protein